MEYQDPYEILSMKDRIAGNSYVGRGICAGFTKDLTRAAFAYFIMGRSANSRNRVFVQKGNDLMIEPFDASKVEDPSLIIYYPVRVLGKRIIVTNGDQTDTIAKELENTNSPQEAFVRALRTRTFEPDGPNWTPRISAVFDLSDPEKPVYEMSILKAGDPEGKAAARFFFDYEAEPGLGHFLHTYITNGEPIPTFCGEPERIGIQDDIQAFSDEIWENLDEDNKISLYVRYTDTRTGKYEDRLINKYVK